VNAIDWVVLLGTMLGIAAYGMWRTRGRRDLNSYLKGSRDTHWLVIGLSVMATQASAITFLSTPGQGFQDGLGFVQNYFGAPFALLVISAFFLPIFRRLNVYTAYEFLGKRFDTKTRLLGAMLFLLQRGIGAGITIYAPAIVLSTVMGWRLDLTILCSGVLVIVYTVTGGSQAVTLTQKYQIGVIFAGMIAAFIMLLYKLPTGMTFSDALSVAGGFHRLNAVNYSVSIRERYTIWSGVLGGMFLALSYFGTDQSQVQRYLSGSSLRESRLGLMFNAVCKIPMQCFILLLGTMLFVFYQFERPPVFFNQTEWARVQQASSSGPALRDIESEFASLHARKRESIQRWLDARHSGSAEAEAAARAQAVDAHQRSEEVRAEGRKILASAGTKANDADYVFITFILNFLPHGLIGLLVAVFFAAALSSKAAELNALGSTTTIDIYRHVIRRDASDRHYVIASKCFTAFWGVVALGFALSANLAENLIQAGNIVGSVFYGVPLAIFLVAFFMKWVRGTAMFYAAIATQLVVVIFYFTLSISYLWYNLIGCAGCVAISIALQLALGPAFEREEALSNPV
jgi:solute:Na+ symporter, SSS family